MLHSPKAFGDGSHPTTQMLLHAIEAMAGEAPERALDMGCGSGILSLAIAQKWPKCLVTAVDIEHESITATRANAAAAGVAARIHALQADGFSHPDIAASGPYDLLVMNMLAAPLVRLAADIPAHLAAQGVVMISGILGHFMPAVDAAYQQVGLAPMHRLRSDDWCAAIWGRI